MRIHRKTGIFFLEPDVRRYGIDSFFCRDQFYSFFCITVRLRIICGSLAVCFCFFFYCFGIHGTLNHGAFRRNVVEVIPWHCTAYCIRIVVIHDL